MAQSRVGSAVEAVVNVLVGLVVAYFAQKFILGVLGHHLSAGENITVSLVMTGVSLVRSYTLRRTFEWISRCKRLTTTRN